MSEPFSAHSRASGNPGTSLQTLGPRFRGDERTRTNLTRRTLLAVSTTAAAALAAPSLARAQTKRWRMVTSWPKRLPGPGMSAERIAERIAALSGGRMQITVHAAGELTPAFEVLDAVGGGVAEMGHTAAFYWQGKMPAAAYFTTVPFGLLKPGP